MVVYTVIIFIRRDDRGLEHKARILTGRHIYKLAEPFKIQDIRPASVKIDYYIESH